MGLLPKKWHFTLRFQLAVLFTILIAAISLLVSIYFPAQLETQQLSSIEDKARSIAEIAAFSVGSGLFLDDVEAVEDAFEVVQQNADLIYVVVLDDVGKIFATFNNRGIDREWLIKRKNENGVSESGRIFNVSVPIWYNTEKIGLLYLGLTLDNLRADIRQSRKTVATVSLAIFALGMIAVFGISTVITAPLRQVVQTVNQIAEGDLTQRAVVPKQNEVAHLARNFNQMVESLESSYHELEGANRSLAKQARELQAEINERKRIENALKVYAGKLERSNSELQDFAYVASHDLQEPLRKIQAFGDRLKSRYGDALDKRGHDYVGRMQNAAGRMQTLITDLLAFSRVTTKAQPFAEVELAKVATEVVSDLEIRIEETGGRVEVGDLPTIDAEPLQMRQLLQNLIGNALKFRREEEPPVVRVSGELLDDATCRIYVEDNGIGFEDKYVDRIFGIFQRLHNRNAYEGTGVGLAICRKIVERHQGKITVESTPGQGTTFIITLPICQPEEDIV